MLVRFFEGLLIEYSKRESNCLSSMPLFQASYLA
jgi:hypothetical protein